jgi:NAD(P)H dehydrogenase (quinone)
MSLVVTGATGHLGRRVVESLLERGVPAADIVAGGRRLENLADLAERGVRVARLDYDDPTSIEAAVEGAEKVLIVSGADMGRRAEQHQAVAQAAAKAGTRTIAYTSLPHASTTALLLAAEHRATEEALRAVGVPFTFLRNAWYYENHTSQIPGFIELGAITGGGGDGRMTGAARSELAEAAAAVLASEGHDNAIYELGADAAYSLPELAALITTYSGSTVVYNDLPLDELTAVYEAAGLGAMAPILADSDRAIAQGELLVETGDLARLIGRAPSTIEDAVRAALA